LVIETPRNIINEISKNLTNSYKLNFDKRKIPLTLKDVIINEENVAQNEEQIHGELFEKSSRFINTKKIKEIKNSFIIGIDSSSRAIITPAADIMISAVSVSGQGPVELCDWPTIYPNLPCNIIKPIPFLYIASDDISISESVRDSVFQTSSLNNEEELSKIMDYSRLRLETWALYEPSKAIGDFYINNDKNFIVLLDGPVYLLEGKNDDIRYNLMKERAEAINSLEKNNIPVIGVVKRLERSKIISKINNVQQIINNCIGNTFNYNDSFIIQKLLYSSCIEFSYGKIYSSLKLKLKYNGLEKIVEYIAIPPGKYQYNWNRGRIFRLEYTENTYEILKENDIEPAQVLVNDSIIKQALEPITIAQSDKRSKMITQVFKDLLISSIMERQLPISYDSFREIEGKIFNKY
jgi:hypothetical protein